MGTEGEFDALAATAANANSLLSKALSSFFAPITGAASQGLSGALSSATGGYL